MSKSKPPLLSPEQMEMQISQIDLLTGMYPGDDEVLLNTYIREWIEKLRNWPDSSFDAELVPSTISFDLHLSLKSEEEKEQQVHLGSAQVAEKVILNIDVPVRQQACRRTEGVKDDPQGTEDDFESEPPPFNIRLRQPSWMTRAQTTQANQDVSIRMGRGNSHDTREGIDVFGAIEFLIEAATRYYHAALDRSTKSNIPLHNTSSTTTFNSKPLDNDDTTNNTTSTDTTIPQTTTSNTTSPTLHRVWFYFPSLSTRSKRDDLVHHAPLYSLTGFVLAGKPGLLVLEGTERNVDEYMRFIKTESWGDIPSYQKKVSERWREVIGGGGGGTSSSGRDGGGGRRDGRVFEGMQEITDMEWMGEKRGERGNRGNMKALEAWLKELGLEEGFERVFV